MDPRPEGAALDGRNGTDGHGFRNRIDAFRKLDEERGELLEVLHVDNERLKLQNEALRREIENLKLTASQTREDGLQHCQLQLQNTELQLRAAHQSMETSPFVLVLIDGNAHTFRDTLLRQGAIGGTDAGSKLRDEIENHAFHGNDLDWKIVVRVYVDFQGLLEDLGGLRNPNIEQRLRKFLGGFTQAQALYDIIDTGPGAKEALVKIKEMFTIFIENVQCKHIYYGCALNETSLSTLEAHKYDPIVASSITLIRSRALDDPNIHIPFEALELPSVFRSSNEAEEVETEASSLGVNGYTSAVHNWNRVANNRSKKASSRNTVRQPQANGVPGSTWDSSERIVLLNINNERVDADLGKIDSKSYDSFMVGFKSEKLCHHYYLLGNCHAPECSYTHQSRLSPEEIQLLRYCVRRIACGQLSKCRRNNCIYGHLCPYEKSGSCTKGRDCAFKAVHDIDRTAVTVWSKGDGPANMYNTPQIPLPEEEDEEEKALHSAWSALREPFPWERQDKTKASSKGKEPISEASSSRTKSQQDLAEIEQAEEIAASAYMTHFSNR